MATLIMDTIMDVIESTMASPNTINHPSSSHGSSNSEASPSYREAAVIGLVFSILLCYLALPHLIAAVLSFGAIDTLSKVHQNIAVDRVEMITAANGLAAASHWVESGEARADQGYLLLHAAITFPPGAERSRLLQQAEVATLAGLALSPSQPSAWLRLSYLRNLRNDSTGAVKALRLSFLSGSFVPSIMKSRVEFALGLLPAMDTEMISLLHRQIRLAWVVEPNFVAGLSGRADAAFLVREALGTMTEEEVTQFVRLRGHRP